MGNLHPSVGEANRSFRILSRQIQKMIFRSDLSSQVHANVH